MVFPNIFRVQKVFVVSLPLHNVSIKMSTSLECGEEIMTSCRLCMLNLSDITWNFLIVAIFAIVLQT
jgi:hypothetical protein